MNLLRFSFSFLIILFSSPVFAESVVRIAFGSCLDASRPVPALTAAKNERPDAFLFLGDNIYADTLESGKLRAEYAKLASNPDFASLKKSTEIFFTYDDHDFGLNDMGGEHPNRLESARIALEFFGEKLFSDRDGIYREKRIRKDRLDIQILILDTRYNRTALKKKNLFERLFSAEYGPYKPNESPNATVLGQKQWQWLEQRFKEPADVRIIMSSIQVLHPGSGWESWANFPKDRQRLLNLIDQSQQPVVILSGDRHFAEISKRPRVHSRPVANPSALFLYDITSSSLNKPLSFLRERNESNSLRTAGPVFEANYGLLNIYRLADDPAEIRMEAHIKDESGRTLLSEKLSGH